MQQRTTECKSTDLRKQSYHNVTEFEQQTFTILSSKLLSWVLLTKNWNNKDLSRINAFMKDFLKMMQGCEKPVHQLPDAVRNKLTQ